MGEDVVDGGGNLVNDHGDQLAHFSRDLLVVNDSLIENTIIETSGNKRIDFLEQVDDFVHNILLVLRLCGMLVLGDARVCGKLSLMRRETVGFLNILICLFISSMKRPITTSAR